MTNLRRGWTIGLVLTGMAMVVCACASYPRSASLEEVALPPAAGTAIRRYLIEGVDYRQWNNWPGKERFSQGRHPHGMLLTTYVSPTVLRALVTRAGRVPDGGMVVKESYAEDRKLVAVSVMYRRPGFNPEGGDWYWLKFAPDGPVLEEGAVATCIACHRQAEENDWLFSGPIK